MASLSSSSKVALAGISILGTGAVAYYFWRRSASSISSPAKGAGAASGLSADSVKLDQPTLLRIFQEITASMQQVMVQLARIEQQLKNNAAQQGKRLSDKDLHEYLMVQFKDAMKRVEQQVYTRHETTEEEVKTAAVVFGEDEEFQLAVDNLKSLYKVFTGKADPADQAEIPARLTIDLVLTVMEETMDGMSDAMDVSFKELKEEGLQEGTEDFNTKLQTMYTGRIAKVRMEVQKKYEIEQKELHSAVIKYQTDQKFQEQMFLLTKKQKERFAQIGVRTVG